MSSPVLDAEMLRFGRLLHYAGLAIVLIVGATTYSWFYAPVDTNILDTEMRIDELTVSSRNAEAIRKEHARLSSQLRKIEGRYAALEERVPVNAEVGRFLKLVSEIANEEQLAISSYRPGQSIQGNGYTAMEVKLDGKGTFKSICSFFDRLARLQRLSKVKDLSLNVDPQGDEIPMNATIVIYYGLLEDTTAASDGEVKRG